MVIQKHCPKVLLSQNYKGPTAYLETQKFILLDSILLIMCYYHRFIFGLIWTIFAFCHGQDSVPDSPRTITINGNWSPWSTIATPCLRENLKGQMVPVSCGGGKMTRKRSCTNPVPQVSLDAKVHRKKGSLFPSKIFEF